MTYRLLGIPLTLGIVLFVVVYSIVTYLNQTEPTISPVATNTVVKQVAEPTLEPAEETSPLGRKFIIGHWADTPVSETTKLLEAYQLGGVIIMSAPEDINEIKNWTSAWQTAVDYPLIIAIDQEGGVVTRLKGSNFTTTAQPEITTTEKAYQVAKARGAELRALGINTNFAPVVETSVSPDGFLYNRVFRDPAMIPKLAAAMLQGYQDSGVTGVIKHYPGHDDKPTDSHYDLPIVELINTTFAEHTKAFRELIKNYNVPMLMTAHVLVPSVDPDYPATLSKRILTGELRENLGYKGLIITDDMSMDAIDKRFSIASATAMALNAGADYILFAAEPEAVIEVHVKLAK